MKPKNNDIENLIEKANHAENLFAKAIQTGDWPTAHHLVKYVVDGQDRIIDAVNRGQGD